MTDTHPLASFWLDAADKLIKLAAVCLGGIWTYWNYRKSRTYAQKLELQLTVSPYRHEGLYVEVTATLKNLGASRHPVQQKLTSCVITGIYADLSEQALRALRIFTRDDFIEPGETISDILLFQVVEEPKDLIWLRVDLRVESEGVEWRQGNLVRVRPVKSLDSAERG